MSKNNGLYQNYIHQQNSMPTSSRIQSLNLKVDPPRTLIKLIHNKQANFFAVCCQQAYTTNFIDCVCLLAYIAKQAIFFVAYAYQHTQPKTLLDCCVCQQAYTANFIDCVCLLAYKAKQANCFAVYACQHRQQKKLLDCCVCQQAYASNFIDCVCLLAYTKSMHTQSKCRAFVSYT